MKNLLKVLTTVILLMMGSNCQKGEWDPIEPPSYSEQDVAIQPRGTADEVFQILLANFRAEIQALIADGILSGENGNGILNRLDNIEKKFLKGQKEVALNMLNALINHLEGLSNAGALSQEIYESLLEDVQNIINSMEYDCSVPVHLIALNGLVTSLPPSGEVTLPPEIFIFYSANECAELSIAELPDGPVAPALELNCTKLGNVYVRIWATGPTGNQDYADSHIIVQDNFDACNGGSDECAPLAITYSGLSVVPNATGEVTLSADEFNAGSIDACNTGNLSFSVRRVGDNSDPTPAIAFNLNDAGIVAVEFWASDGVHSSMAVTNVFVADILPPRYN